MPVSNCVDWALGVMLGTPNCPIQGRKTRHTDATYPILNGVSPPSPPPL